MNERERYEETGNDIEDTELTNAVSPSIQGNDTNEHHKSDEDDVQAQPADGPGDTLETQLHPEETVPNQLSDASDDTPAADDAHAVSGHAIGEPPATLQGSGEMATGDPAPYTNAVDEGAPASSGIDTQAEELKECPRMVLQAGTDEQSLKALSLCREKVKQLHLKMRPLAARYEGEKHVTIYFRADDKVDFRKLVRELSRLLHARIELRQVGPREQGKLCGLLGKCGYALCCQTFLGPQAQSTIKMAKTQELALNPMKISGVCGRLLCCLNYEQEMYAEAKSRMPKVNRVVDTEFGPGRVIAVSVLKDTVTVQLETMIRELRPDQVRLSGTHE